MDASPLAGATWRRLKIAAEVKLGHGIPRLPDAELRKLLGVLALVRDGHGRDEVGDDARVTQAGEAEGSGLATDGLRARCVELARAVDVRPLL